MSKTSSTRSINIASESSTASGSSESRNTSSQTQQSNIIVHSISTTLMQLITDNKAKPHYNEKLKQQAKQIYTSRKLPQISVNDYIVRIAKYMKIEDSTLILALIYIDRISRKRKIFVNEYNVYRLFFMSVVVATKYNEDKHYSNTYYAKIGGVELEQLNQMECEFVMSINFDLFVEAKVFDKYETSLVCNYTP
jgi:hypothetical protein